METKAKPISEPEIEVESTDLLATLQRAEIDQQIATAKRYPRSLDTFRKEVLALATVDAETARTMYFVIPRDGKNIEGASVRLAEVVGSSWGNLRYGGRIVDIDDRFVTAQGMAFDLQKNLACTIEVRRSIVGRHGRYSDDMIKTTAMAAISIAQRNAIFKVVPFALVKHVYEEAKKVSLGKGLTMEQRHEVVIKAFEKLGAKEKDVLAIAKRKGRPDLSVDDLIMLQGVLTAIRDGETTLAEVLEEATRSERSEAAGKGGLGSIADTIVDNPPPNQQEDRFLNLEEQDELEEAIFSLGLASKSREIAGVVQKILGVAGLDQVMLSQKAAAIVKLRAAQ